MTSEITVEEVQHAGSDALIVQAARQSTKGEDAGAEASRGLLNTLVRLRHTSPLEHTLLTCRVHAPAMVWWEWVRHRFQAVDCPDLSFSLESGRYRELQPVFWVPRPDRPMIPEFGYKAMKPRFEVADSDTYAAIIDRMTVGYKAAWEAYQECLRMAVSKEVSRAVLGFGVYYHGWVSGNVNAILNFLSKRVQSPDNAVPTFPQQEIAEAAGKVEAIFASYWPVTHAAWVQNGRQAP